MMMYCDICGAKLENGENLTECPECLCDIIGYKSLIPDGSWVKGISNDENFMKAMVELYKNNPIEYQLKIKQIKLMETQEDSKSNNSNGNIPHCPTCGSENVEKISLSKKAVGGAVFGLFSSNIRNTMHCKNCGAKW